MKKLISDDNVHLMHILMNNKTIGSKVRLSGEKGKTYEIYTVRPDGVVVLGETRVRWWNQLIQCQFKLPFESWALAVWDALVDLSKDANKIALEEGLSKEIAKEAQRGGNYDWVIERLHDCYMHVCNNVEGRRSSEGDRDVKGSTTTQRVYVRDNEPVVVNINAGSVKRTVRFPDATGRAFLNFDLGIVGVHTSGVD